MLKRIEESYEHKEPADLSNVQIEHVMPQTLTTEWIKEIGDNAEEHHARLLHTLGNLTLTGYNQDLSNRPYIEKRTMLKESHFVLNRYFDNVERWSPDEIVARAQSIAKRAISIWSDVGREGLTQVEAVSPGQKPVAVRFKTKTFPIKTWKDGTAKLLEAFEGLHPGVLASIVSTGELSRELSTDPDRFPRSKVAVGGVYFNTHASKIELKRRLRKIAERIGIDEKDYGYVFANDPYSAE